MISVINLTDYKNQRENAYKLNSPNGLLICFFIFVFINLKVQPLYLLVLLNYI